MDKAYRGPRQPNHELADTYMEHTGCKEMSAFVDEDDCGQDEYSPEYDQQDVQAKSFQADACSKQP